MPPRGQLLVDSADNNYHIWTYISLSLSRYLVEKPIFHSIGHPLWLSIQRSPIHEPIFVLPVIEVSDTVIDTFFQYRKTLTKYLLRFLQSGNPPLAYQSPECPVGLKTPFSSPSSSKPHILGPVGPAISGPRSVRIVSGINLNPVLRFE